MKKFMISACAMVALTFAVHADMNDVTYDLTAVAAGVVTNDIVLRGTLKSVFVDVTAPGTSTVQVLSVADNRTLFSKSSVAADASFLPLAAGHTTAGAAATFVGGTNDTANAWYVEQPMAGIIRVILTAVNGAAVTNNTKVTLTYDR